MTLFPSGLTREWYNILAREMFNPNYALFSPAGGKSSTFHPNAMSSINPDHIQFLKFVGRIIGKAVHDGYNISRYFFFGHCTSGGGGQGSNEGRAFADTINHVPTLSWA